MNPAKAQVSTGSASTNPPETTLRLQNSELELVFHNGIPLQSSLSVSIGNITHQQVLNSAGGGLAFVPLSIPQMQLLSTLDHKVPVNIAVSSPGRNSVWTIEPLMVFNSQAPGLPLASAPVGDTQSTGTLQAEGSVGVAKLSYAGIGNDYVQFPLNIPLPADAVSVGGFFRLDPTSPIHTLFSFRVGDGQGETYGYFAPTSPSGETQLTLQPLENSGYHFGGESSNPPAKSPLLLNALLFDTSDHKQSGAASVTLHNLFVVRRISSEVSPTAPPPQPSTITVDFARQAPPVKSMVGFLHGCSETQPSDDRLVPLKPALWRIGYLWMQNRDRLARLGIPTVLILSDSSGPDSQKDRPSWEAYVRKMADYAGGKPYTWDLWNEPDLSQFWKGTQEGSFEKAVTSISVLRDKLGPATVISGPSISHYNLDYLTQFLDYLKAHHARLAVLSWHELDVDANIPVIADHLREARAKFLDNPAYASLGIKKIEINEIVGPGAQYQPGEILGYFYYLEKGGADGACKGCWDDNCGNNTLDGILTPDTHEPRAAWWAYKAYADSTVGRVRSISSDLRLGVFASHPLGAAQAQALVGYFGYANYSHPTLNVALHLLNLPPFVMGAGNTHITVERIPDSQKAALPALEKTVDAELSVIRGAVDIMLPPLAVHEAYLVTVSRGKG